MLHVALLCLLVGQVPQPPVPHPPESYEQSPSYPSANQLPADPKAQREWLLAHLVDDLEAQGKLDAHKYREVESMLKNATDGQVGAAVQYYQQRKAQVEAEQLAEAQANLRRLQAYRDRLKLEVARRNQVYQQEQAMMDYGSALAQQQGQWAMGNFYAAQAWPYYYAPYPHYHHHHHW